MNPEFTEQIRETVLKHNMICDGDHIIAGLSGGPDSVSLFHVLLQLSNEMNFSMSAVHVNHGFRPGDADDDQRYVEELCAKYAVSLTVKSIDVLSLAAELDETPEEAGRTARYRAFAEEASLQESNGIDGRVCIAVAHNRNDQIETVLMRLIRGTGTDGLAGMHYTRTDEYGYSIIRPLLNTDRKDIESYCEQHHLDPRRDRTNDEPKYFRNRIRLNLLPFLRETFGDAVETAILRLSANAAEDKDFFATVTEEAIDEYSVHAGFPLDVLRDTHPAIRHRLITALFADIGLTQDIEAAHLKAADILIERGETGKSIDFPGSYRMGISYENVVFASPGDIMQDGVELTEPSIDEYEDENGITVLEAKCGEYTARFDALSIASAGLVPTWRTRMPGDIMRPKGMTGSKKLQDVFVDKKVPRHERDTMMLFAVGSEVLWVPGIRISRMFTL